MVKTVGMDQFHTILPWRLTGCYRRFSISSECSYCSHTRHFRFYHRPYSCLD